MSSKTSLIHIDNSNNDVIITNPKLNKYNKILEKYWGYKSLKNEQFDVISNILDGRDVCAILATGFGKSVCYQLPTMISKKCVIVISPLIALMHEQSEEMKSKNIPVCVFNSSNQEYEKELFKDEILRGEYKLIYMTPEYLIKSEKFIKQLVKNNNLSMICIDESHAVSTWGLDFRSSYTKLNVIREWIPNIPILTLTATATTKVKEDIIKILNLQNPFEIIGNFDRPNLFIKVQPRSDNFINSIGNILTKYKDEYIIIYCKTRDETDNLAIVINDAGINCDAYHAGLSDKIRKSIQQKFIDGEIKCIIATIAFGMGINIPNVRLVIHYNCPKNIESYYQEIGRAGRDGKSSECHLYYSNKDFYVNRIFLKTITDLTYKNYQESQIRLIEKFVYSNECRRKLLLVNFGQYMDNCNNCDNCLAKKKSINNIIMMNEQIDYTKPIYLLLNLLNRIDNKFGMLTIINTLLGNAKKIRPYMCEFNEFGTGTVFGKEVWWRALIRSLINDDYIIESQITGGFGTTISLTNKGKQIKQKLNKQFPKYVDLLQKINSFDDEKDNIDSDDSGHYNNYKLMLNPIFIETKTKPKTKTKPDTKLKTKLKTKPKKNINTHIYDKDNQYDQDDQDDQDCMYIMPDDNEHINMKSFQKKKKYLYL